MAAPGSQVSSVALEELSPVESDPRKPPVVSVVPSDSVLEVCSVSDLSFSGAGSVLGDVPVDSCSAPSAPLVSVSVVKDSGSFGLGFDQSVSLFAAGPDVASAGLGFVAQDFLSAGLVSKSSVLTGSVSATSLSLTAPSPSSASVPAPSFGLASGSAPSELLVLADKAASSSLELVAGSRPGSESESVESVDKPVPFVLCPGSAGLSNSTLEVVSAQVFSIDSTQAAVFLSDASGPVSVPVPVELGLVAASPSVSEPVPVTAAAAESKGSVQLPVAASGLLLEKPTDSAVAGLYVSAAEPNGSHLSASASVSAGPQPRVSSAPQVLTLDAATVVASKCVSAAVLKDSELSKNKISLSNQSLAQIGVEIPKKSYSSVVQQKPSLSKHNLSVVSEDGVQVVQVPEDILSNVHHLWDDLIIGKFPDDSPHIAKVHVIVNKIWAYGNKSSRVDAFVVNKSTIKFRIKDQAIRDRVLRRGMWNIADKPMLVSKYGPIDEADSAPRSMSLWVTLSQIPPAYYSWKGLSFLSSVIGEPKRLHPETELCNKFDQAKVFIEVDLTKPLPDSFSFKSSNGVVSEVKYSYPWLPPRCCACGKWGHLIDVCRTVSILKRNSKIPDPPHPVDNITSSPTTDAGGGFASPLIATISDSVILPSVTSVPNQISDTGIQSAAGSPTPPMNRLSPALSHPVGQASDEGDRGASPSNISVPKQISETGNQSSAGSPTPPKNQLSPALSHPVGQASDEGDRGVSPSNISRVTPRETVDKEGWSLVSPKKSHHAQKVIPATLQLGSPSSFSVLIDQEAPLPPPVLGKPPPLETQEAQSEIISETVHQQEGKIGEPTIRPSLPRQSKTARKNKSSASNLNRKGEVTKKKSN